MSHNMRPVCAKQEIVLSEGETKRRIEAARVLRGLNQDELDELGQEYGLGRQELSRTERGTLPCTEARRAALAKLLRFPEEWFLAENVDSLIRWPATRGDEVSRVLEQLVRAVQAQPPDPPGNPRGPAGGGHPPANHPSGI